MQGISESEEKASKLHSQMELFKMEEQAQKLENEQEKQSARKELVANIADLEERQTELIEKLKVTKLTTFRTRIR